MMGLGNTTNFSTGKTLSFALSYANGPFKAGGDLFERAQPHAVDRHDRHHHVPGRARRDLHRGQGAEHGRGRVIPVRQAARARAVHAREAGIERTLGHVSELRRRRELSVHAVQLVAGGAATTTLAGHRWTQFEIGDIYALSKSTQLYVNALYEHARGSGAKAAFFTAGVSSGTAIRRSC